MDTAFCEEYEIPQSEIGLSVTCFCPVCRAQVFGFLRVATIDDLVTHMNYVHPQTRSGSS